MTKVCVVLPYFGAFKSYFNVFVKSCTFNKDIIDYKVFSSTKFQGDLPSNVIFFDFSLEDFNTLATTKLGFEIALTPKSRYKLVDFKPAYGLIFEDYLKGYDYWGFGDEDLVLGDLKKCLSPLLSKGYDVISGREGWISGAFTLLKNNSYTRELFMQSPNHQYYLQSNTFFSFTECFKTIPRILKGECILAYDHKKSFTYLVKDAERKGEIKVHFFNIIKESIPKDDFVLFDFGKISDRYGREYLLYHYITEKKSCNFEFIKWSVVPDKFYIDNTGFFTEKQFFGFRKIIRFFRLAKGKIKKSSYYFKRVLQKIHARI